MAATRSLAMRHAARAALAAPMSAIRSETTAARAANLLVRLTNEIDGRGRQIASRHADDMPVTPSVLERRPPWRDTAIADHRIPGMISREEKTYYRWLAPQYTGWGAVIELGPWLGASTAHIIDGLRQRGTPFRLRTFDDFVWRSSWMDQHLRGTGHPIPGNHESFRHLFDHYMASYLDDVDVTTCKISDYDGNETLPPLAWDDGPIEMAFIDCGRTIDANRAWWDVLVDSFVPGKTLLILQDWQTHKAVPRRPYNQMHLFTAQRRLRLVHELRDGGVATFLVGG